MSTFQKYQKHLFAEQKALAAPVTTELSRAEMAPDQIEGDNARLAEIGRRLDQAALPVDKQWPIGWGERVALEAEADSIRSLHAWYADTRDRLFKMAGGVTDSTFVMRLDSSAPDSATAERLRVLEAAAGVEAPRERERTGTKELWSTCTNRAPDLVERIRMFASFLVQHGYIPVDHGVELRPPSDVRGDAIRQAELAERETAGVIRAEILKAVREHAAKQAFGDPSISQGVVERTAAAQAERDALTIYNCCPATPPWSAIAHSARPITPSPTPDWSAGATGRGRVRFRGCWRCSGSRWKTGW